MCRTYVCVKGLSGVRPPAILGSYYRSEPLTVCFLSSPLEQLPTTVRLSTAWTRGAVEQLTVLVRRFKLGSVRWGLSGHLGAVKRLPEILLNMLQVSVQRPMGYVKRPCCLTLGGMLPVEGLAKAVSAMQVALVILDLQVPRHMEAHPSPVLVPPLSQLHP